MLKGPFADFSDAELESLFSPIGEARHLAVAVSGGSDSMALLHLAARWASERRLTILTVHHGLRAASAGEAEQVAQWSATLGLAHVSLRWEGKKPANGIQAAAREARYRLLREWCELHGAAILLTAHTLDDQAETVLMRMSRGVGIEGLIGIWRTVRLSPSVTLYRPLLGVPRQRLRSMLASLGQAWIDDPSNEDERFERVRVRRLMPALTSVGLSAEKLALIAVDAFEAHSALDEVTTKFLAHSSTHCDLGYCVISRSDYNELNGEMKLLMLRRQIGTYGGGNIVERDELERLVAALDLGRVKHRTLGGAIIAVRTREILIGREPGRIDSQPVSLADGMLWDGRFIICSGHCDDLTVAPAPRQPKCELPDFVRRSLPAIFKGEALVAIPSLGIGDPDFAVAWRKPSSPAFLRPLP